MSFYIKKSVSVGPFRFNLSKSGIGISAGIVGLRFGNGPRGTYVHAGRGGVYYRKTLSSEPAGVLFHPKSPTEAQDAPQQSDLNVIDSGSVLHMVDAKSADVLQELNYRPQSHEVWLAVICTVAVMSGLFISRLPLWLSGVASATGLFVIFLLQQRSSVKKTVAMLYDLEPEVEQVYARLHGVFDELRGAEAVWHVEARGNTAREIRRKRISITTGLPPFVRSNLEAPMIPVGKQTLFFFPDMLLVYEGGEFGAVNYEELNVEIKSADFRFQDKEPSDAKIDEIHFNSDSGLNELVQTSQQGVGAKLKNALIALRKFSNGTKARIS